MMRLNFIVAAAPRRLLCVLALLTPTATGCGPSEGRLGAAERAALKDEIKAELEPELLAKVHKVLAEHDRAAATVAPRPTLSAGELAAIAEARDKRDPETRAAVPPPVNATPPDVVEPPPPTEPADDTVTEAVPDTTAPPAADTGPAPSGDEIRPGAQIWPSKGALQLTDLAIATGIDDRLPVNVDTHFETRPEMFFCYTVFDNREQDNTVTHVWRRGTRLVSKVELEVGKSPTWRTWSRQRTRQNAGGPWTCEVLDPAGQRIGLATFTVGGAAP